MLRTVRTVWSITGSLMLARAETASGRAVRTWSRNHANNRPGTLCRDAHRRQR